MNDSNTTSQEYEEKYKVLYESSADAIMILEPPSWKFTAGNSATIKMFRTKDEAEFISFSPDQLSPEMQPDGQKSGDKAKEMIGIAVENGTNFFEWTHKRSNGEDFPAEVLLTRFTLNGETALQATVRDISKRKEIEDELLERTVSLKEINDLMVNRELKMIELKKEITELKTKKC